jgi:two-component system LytT family response regulator
MIIVKPLKKIKSIIIDDELANRNLLTSMLQKHCGSIEILGIAASADEGFELINATNPELIFLDVQMPENSGFDLLRRFRKIHFNVIFVSAFDQYAIEAFEFNALDYILKPVDHTKLIKAVTKAETKIEAGDYSDVVHFVHSLEEKDQLQKRISLHLNDKVHLVNINEICYIQAMRAYSEIVLTDNKKYVSGKTLSDYENMFGRFDHFLRINKSLIINVNHVKDYSKGADCVITIGNNSEVEVSRRKKASIIQQLKNLIQQ